MRGIQNDRLYLTCRFGNPNSVRFFLSSTDQQTFGRSIEVYEYVSE